jgi:hypothetical protein
MMLTLLFPLAGIIRDWRAVGRPHPAWWVGIGAILAWFAASEIVPHTALGQALYARVIRGAPAALADPLDYPPFPPGFPIAHP